MFKNRVVLGGLFVVFFGIVKPSWFIAAQGFPHQVADEASIGSFLNLAGQTRDFCFELFYFLFLATHLLVIALHRSIPLLECPLEVVTINEGWDFFLLNAGGRQWIDLVDDLVFHDILQVSFRLWHDRFSFDKSLSKSKDTCPRDCRQHAGALGPTFTQLPGLGTRNDYEV